MKNFGRKNRVVQGDRVIEGRVIEGEYCIIFLLNTFQTLQSTAINVNIN